MRSALLVFFLWLTGRYWHPYYGFTRFLQMDAGALATATPALRDAPIYTYRDAGGYDGHYYAQLAADPTLRDPGLAGGMDNYYYRARRIMDSAVAHFLAGADPGRAVRIYAGLNLGAWLGLAGVLWYLLPPGDWRAGAAWAGVLFTAGSLHAVRCALPDLPTVLWLALGFMAVERGRYSLGGGLLALAALTRETTLLAGAVAAGFVLWHRGPRTALAVALPAFLPVAAWLLYIRLRLGQSGGGWNNFNIPFYGWGWKWTEAAAELGNNPHTLLALSTLMALIALTVQALYMLVARQWSSLWWWLGLTYTGFLALLNDGVWTGHPGAAARVLLPLSLAFAILAWRARARWWWLAGGNLGILGGILTLWFVPREIDELAAGRATEGTYVVHAARGFYPVEHQGGRTWSWCATEGRLEIACWPRTTRATDVVLRLSAISERPLEIHQAGRRLWVGSVGRRTETVDVPGVQLVHGRAALELKSPSSPMIEEAVTGRELGYAVHGVVLP